jgi:hypothetical protein
MPARPQKITFGEMRSTGVRGLLIYCADYHCSHSIAIVQTGGRMTSGCQISSRSSSARPAATAAPMQECLAASRWVSGISSVPVRQGGFWSLVQVSGPPVPSFVLRQRLRKQARQGLGVRLDIGRVEHAALCFFAGFIRHVMGLGYAGP